MTETATENATPAVEAEPVMASLNEADQFTQNLVPLVIDQIKVYNEVKTRNDSRTKGLDEIIADLKETSQNEKVVQLREKRAQIEEAIAKAVTDEAKALKAETGEPDLEAEKSAKAALDGLLKALHSFPDGKKVGHFLPDVVKGSTRVGGTTSGPARDLSAVRAWAKENGFPDVKERGRLSEDIMDAYNKANPGATV